MQTLKMALNSILGNKLRALLTMLGIIIGVMALVTLVSLVNSASGTVMDTIASIGSDLITVTISDDKGVPLRLSDLDQYAALENVGEVAAYGSESAVIKSGSESATATVYGTTSSYQKIQELELLVGRFIKKADVDNHTYVCVINEAAATDLVGYLDCLGEQIAVNGTKFTVVGVLKDNEDSLTAAFTKGSKTVYIPYTALQRLSSSISYAVSSFQVSAAEGSTTDKASEVIEARLMERFEQDDDAFSISNTNVIESAAESISSVWELLLGGIASISLIVGGIGIMNIMLVSVTERTREIGIRKAIGASRSAILWQFLLEAIVLSLLGCFIGIMLSWGILRAINIMVSGMAIQFTIQPRVVLLSVAFCFGIGVIFGLYPANKAAKMQPIDALHYAG